MAWVSFLGRLGHFLIILVAMASSFWIKGVPVLTARKQLNEGARYSA